MTVKKKQIFGRILQHRLESAKLFPNLGETGKAFTEYVQGNPISKPAIVKTMQPTCVLTTIFNTVYIAERSDDYDSQEKTNFW